MLDMTHRTLVTQEQIGKAFASQAATALRLRSSTAQERIAKLPSCATLYWRGAKSGTDWPRPIWANRRRRWISAKFCRYAWKPMTPSAT